MLNTIAFALVSSVVLAATGPATAATPGSPVPQLQHIVLAGGCFWGMEAVFDDVKGVTSAVAGYAGGSKATAHYEIVSTGLTGHAESVLVSFDPSRVSLQQILQVYFLVAHDPTELDRQGPDEGTQYRSAIFYTDDEQKRVALAYIKKLQDDKVFDKPIVTQVVPLPAFYPAEGYHQHYVANHPDSLYVQYNDLPKLEQLHKRYPQLAKSS